MQLLDADRARLTQFAAELDKEAETLERRAISLSPATVPQPPVQQQSAESSTPANVPAGEPRD